MQLMVDGEVRDFIEIKAFRAEHDLPPDFRVAYFEPKDYTGLGSIDGAAAGGALATLKQRVLDRLPHGLDLNGWLRKLPDIQQMFRDELEAINEHIGLRPVEIEFAAAGYGDVCQSWVYALIQTQAARRSAPTYVHIYRDWLFGTVRVSAYEHPYEHQNQPWLIQLITHAYGRIGMIVRIPGRQWIYVYDAALACPAEGYMLGLLRDVTARIAADVGLDPSA